MDPTVSAPELKVVICDGDLPSLVACHALGEDSVIAGTARRPGLYIPSFVGEEASARHAAAIAMAELYELEIIHGRQKPLARSDAEAGLAASVTLLRAAWAAVGSGRSVVVWPAHGGTDESSPDLPDVPKAALIIERSILTTRLAALDAVEHRSPSIQIVAPYADLTDRELAELADDMNVPVRTCWWNAATGAGAGGVAAARWRRWLVGGG
jgi:hypothetical protein